MRTRSESLMQKILAFVDEYAMNNLGKAPSTREIGAEFSISHVSAHRYLKTMTERGMLQYEDGEIHTELIDKFNINMSIVGSLDLSVPAGSPDMVDDVYVEEYFPLPSALLHGLSGRFFMMAVRGESMLDAGIEEGDHVIFREDSCPREDDIVVAYIEGAGNTLKRFCRDEIGPYLWAENESWSDEKRDFGRNFVVIGVVLKVMKDV